MHYLRDILHRDSHPASSIFIKQKQPNSNRIWNVEKVKLSSITSLSIGGNRYNAKMNDIYTPINPMFSLRAEATKENISYINWLYVDLDNKENNPSFAHDTLSRLQDESMIASGFTGKLPQPSLVVESGTGLWLFWRVKSKGRYDFYQQEKMNNAIAEMLSPYGSDFASTNSNRISRVIGTINSKNGSLVTGHYNDAIEYELADFDYLTQEKPREIHRKTQEKAYKPKTEAQKRAIAKTRGNLKDDYQLAIMKANDLVTLTRLRNGHMTGHRTNALFILASAMALLSRLTANEPYWVFEQLDFVNQQFTEPLPDSDLLSIIRSASKERISKDGGTSVGIKWQNDTIIERLSITDEEQRELAHIRSSELLKEYDRERKRKARRSKGMKTKEQYQAQRLAEQMEKVAQIKKAIQDDSTISNRKLAELLGVSAVAIGKIRKKYKV